MQQLSLLDLAPIPEPPPPPPAVDHEFTVGDRVRIVQLVSHPAELLGQEGIIRRIMRGAVVLVMVDVGDRQYAFNPCHLAPVSTVDTPAATVQALDRVEIMTVLQQPPELVGRFGVVLDVSEVAGVQVARVLMERPSERMEWVVRASDLRPVEYPDFCVIEPMTKAGKPRLKGDPIAWQIAWWTRFAAEAKDGRTRRWILEQFAWRDYAVS